MPRRRSGKHPGLPPGSLVHVGQHVLSTIGITVIDYDVENCSEKSLTTVQECQPYKDSPTVTWINVKGLNDVSVIETLGRMYDIHPLTSEDILNTYQRPKVDEHDNYIYFALKMVTWPESAERIQSEQISMLLGSNWVITFQETGADIFDPIRQRIREKKGRIRRMGADYLAYSIIDTLIDHYFVLLEKYDDHMEVIEEVIETNAAQASLTSIHSLEKNLIELHKLVWPQLDIIRQIHDSDSKLFQEATQRYFTDIQDHLLQIRDNIDSYRELTANLVELYHITLNTRMNEVMKVLAVIAAIFVPLHFITGIYGMNFKHMPELDWPWGYGYAIFLMCAVATGLLYFFRRKKWL